MVGRSMFCCSFWRAMLLWGACRKGSSSPKAPLAGSYIAHSEPSAATLGILFELGGRLWSAEVSESRAQLDLNLLMISFHRIGGKASYTLTHKKEMNADYTILAREAPLSATKATITTSTQSAVSCSNLNSSLYSNAKASNPVEILLVRMNP